MLAPSLVSPSAPQRPAILAGMTDAPGPVYLSLAEAADAVDASRTTIRRRLNDGTIEGAHRTASGGWAIPYAGLIGAGLAPRTTPATEGHHTDNEPPPAAEGAPTATEAELERLRTRLAVLEGLADERAATIATLTMVLERITANQLTAGPEVPTATATVHTDKRWWQRRK
jgi:hypothetical protein